MSDPTGPRREEALRLSGTVGANRVMESELLRLVKRSPFRVRVPRPLRQGSTALRYPFAPELAWVAACYHRSCSRVSWELASSEAVRLEPLVADLVPLLASDDRLPRGGGYASPSRSGRLPTSRPGRFSCAAPSRAR